MNDQDRYLDILTDLRSIGSEQESFEFKVNQSNPEMIGKYISALSNAAALNGKNTAFLIWGVEDKSLNLVGTKFNPYTKKADGQPLQLWLSQRLNPSVLFEFREIIVEENTRIVFLEIASATTAPIEFARTAYIRIGEATPRLADHTSRQAKLWSNLRAYVWEHEAALHSVGEDEVFRLLDYDKYFMLLGLSPPSDRSNILELLTREGFIEKDYGSKWNILNLGAVLIGKRLTEFGTKISRKQIRITKYDGVDRTAQVTNRIDVLEGYALAFDRTLEFIENLLPSSEILVGGIRHQRTEFPIEAIRELLANTIIHQDFSVTGMNPSIDIFDHRIEFTNAGQPLNPVIRFIDFPPKSRNEELAALMRRFGICEEGGTGIDKVVRAAELWQLPPPEFLDNTQNTIVKIWSQKKFSDLSTDEKLRACFQHAALLNTHGKKMTNKSLRARLGVEDQNASSISRIFASAVERNLIKLADAENPKSGYVPFYV